ncbi:MAG TPA: guanosine-3',5'-bis(diphosphate) 3'-diphosphatase, partial [Dokdonella sp.]
MDATAPGRARAPADGRVPAFVRALEAQLAVHLPPEQVLRVRRAYEVGAEAHEGQTRKSGEAYITHPVAVAGILAELG